jgi:hypothetical protein
VPDDSHIAALCSDLERVINQGGSRGADAFLRLTRGALFRSARSLTTCENPSVAFVTGFYLPHARPPAAESDGPLAVAIAAGILHQAGIPAVVVTDRWSADVVHAAMAGAGSDPDQLLVAARQSEVAGIEGRLRQAAVSHLIFVERAGAASDGKRYSMSGIDISPRNLAFDALARNVPWTTIAVGDGGNEIGMGAIPKALLAGRIAHGEKIGARQRVNELISATVSNWGCYALIAALAAMRPDLQSITLQTLTAGTERAILEFVAARTRIVDGMLLRPARSVDGFSLARSGRVIDQIRARMLLSRKNRPQGGSA